MDIHVCKQCGSQFVYCRACTFRPVRYKDAGFCSKECYEASKNKVVQAVEPEVVIDSVLVEEPKQAEEIVADVISINEDASAEIQVVAETSNEVPVAETIKVVEPTIKKETNTSKNKKKSIKYTSSL